MKRVLALAGLVVVVPTAAFGALSATAVLTPSNAGPTYHYDAVVNDTGSTTVGTFWYSWVPGEDFLLTSPINITSPTGWASSITHIPNVNTNGYAIQWKATTAASDIAAGASLAGFGFDTTDTPGQLQGNSAYYPTTPVGTSFVYSGAPFSDGGFQFVASTAPEPASIGALVVTPLMLLLRRRK